MSYDVEKVNPYNDTEGKRSQVQRMFNHIAPAYDFMNHAMTLGLDKYWRKRAVALLRSYSPRRILDVACGTGDFSMELCRSLHPDTLVGVDLADGMLDVARRKFAGSQYADMATFESGDCSAMRFANESFDAVTSAFGVRNFENLLDCYREMYRVLRPGGILCVLELSQPASPLILPLYNMYTRGVIPVLGRLVSSDSRAYSYLPESIAAVPQRDNMIALMERAGFTGGKYEALTFGVCTAYIAQKP